MKNMTYPLSFKTKPALTGRLSFQGWMLRSTFCMGHMHKTYVCSGVDISCMGQIHRGGEMY
jgi:hypothetical protein